MKAVLTKEEARFLLNYDLTKYSEKLKAIEDVQSHLNFEDEVAIEEFFKAVIEGEWDVQTDGVIINVLKPFGGKAFLSDSAKTNQLIELTDDVTKAKVFTLEELSEVSAYESESFMLSEYRAFKEYGDVVTWLNDNQERNQNVAVEAEILRDVVPEVSYGKAILKLKD